MSVQTEICGAGEFVIKADGTWLHDNAPIGRAELVRLFAAVLVRDEAGAYWLQTPAEKVPVRVEDAPFIAVELACEGQGRRQLLRIRTNAGQWVDLGEDHPLIMRGTADRPRPYVRLGGGLEALVARPVYYQLAALADHGTDNGADNRTDDGAAEMGIWSGGCFFPLMAERET